MGDRGTAGGPRRSRPARDVPGPSSANAPARRAEELCDGLLDGDRRALARLLTAIENRSAVAEHALRRLYPLAGRAHLVGITGPPGAGKSTLVAALIGESRRAGRAVGVIAVDPSSPITGGALLGDRVRMQSYAGDRDVFIRSMAARGHAGGLAATSSAAAAAMDAAGFDLILLETVGTGQSEVEVAAAADTTVVLEAPEMGDEIQAIKAGLLEVADLVVVNKGDRPGAQRTASQLRAMLSAAAPPDPGDGRPRPKRPDVLVTTAATGEGVPALLKALDRLRAPGHDRASARLARAEHQVWAIVVERLRERLRAPGHWPATEATLAAVAAHDLDPYSAADSMLATLGAVPPKGTGGDEASAPAGARDDEHAGDEEGAGSPERSGDAAER